MIFFNRINPKSLDSLAEIYPTSKIDPEGPRTEAPSELKTKIFLGFFQLKLHLQRFWESIIEAHPIVDWSAISTFPEAVRATANSDVVCCHLKPPKNHSHSKIRIKITTMPLTCAFFHFLIMMTALVSKGASIATSAQEGSISSAVAPTGMPLFCMLCYISKTLQ